MKLKVKTIYDDSKVATQIEILDFEKGVNIFPKISIGNQFTSILLEGVQNCTELESLDNQIEFLDAGL